MVPGVSTNGSGDTYTFQYAADNGDQPLIAVVESVAWVKGVEPLDLEPLHHAIDVDTLNDLVGGGRPEFTRRDSRDANLEVRFRYEGCLVTVSADEITVERDPD